MFYTRVNNSFEIIFGTFYFSPILYDTTYDEQLE